MKPKECSICGGEKRIVAHHKDYSRPLDVLWMCNSCHVNLHNNIGGKNGR